MRYLRNLFLLLFIATLAACTKEADYITTIPVSDNPFLQSTDSFSAVGTIYRPDSFATSAKSLLFIGKQTDAVFGKTTATPYFRMLGPSSLPDLEGNSYFDSLVLVIKPSTVYYGDTTVSFGVDAYRLAADMNTQDGIAFYNNEGFATDADKLGTTSVVYRPNIDTAIRIKLNANLGQEFFALARLNSTTLTDASIFQDYFKGIKLQSSAANNVIYAISNTDTGITMQLHYHKDVGTSVAGVMVFTLDKTLNSFYAVDADRSGTPLEALNTSSEIPAKDLIVNDELTNLRTRFKFPYANDILKQGTVVKILNATLQLKPVQTYYVKSFALPPQLNLYYHDISGTLTGPALYQNSTSEVQDGDLQVDYNYGEGTNYVFDISTYLTEELTTTSYTTRSLVLVLPDENNKVYRLVAGMTGAPYASKLIVSSIIYNYKQ